MYKELFVSITLQSCLRLHPEMSLSVPWFNLEVVWLKSELKEVNMC